MVNEVDELAQFIRTVDGNHKMGAGELAQRIIEAGWRREPDWEKKQRAWPYG